MIPRMSCRPGISCSRLFSNAGGAKGKKAYKPLSILAASEQGNAVDLKLALDKGVCIETRGRYGSTPLMFAAQFGHPSCVSLLLNHGASLDAEIYGTTALSCAAVEGQMECMALLLNRGASIDSVDEGGMTPLLHSARYGHQGCLLLLLSRGAKINYKNNTGNTAVMLAVMNKHRGCVDILLDKGASTTEKDNEGKTALDYCDDEEMKSALVWRRK